MAEESMTPEKRERIRDALNKASEQTGVFQTALKPAPSEAEIQFIAENLTKLGDAVEAMVNASRNEDESSLRRAIEQSKVIRAALRAIECGALCVASNADLRLMRLENGTA